MSGLLANAVYEARITQMRPYMCPRCNVEILLWHQDEDEPEDAAISRTSRGENDAPIPICSRCGEREAFSAAGANPEDPSLWRTGAGVSAPTSWPLSVDQLLAEDRVLYMRRRSSELMRMDSDELDTDDEG